MVHLWYQSFLGVWYFLFTVSNEHDGINIVDQLDSMSNRSQGHKVQSTSDYIITGESRVKQS